MIHLLVAEGAAALARRSAVLIVALTIFLLCQPAYENLWNELIVTRSHGGFDTHGDLLPDLLDYLERPQSRPGASDLTPSAVNRDE